jgi:hypothetical protein
MYGFVSYKFSLRGRQNWRNFLVPASRSGASKHPKTVVRYFLPPASPVIQSEQLLQALSQCDDQLDRWISKSQANAVLLMEDPMAAMHAAAADLDQDVLRELEAVLSGLARKLDMPISPLPNSAFRRPS